MPMLILHPDANPFELVIEVFVAFVDPRPYLLLYVTAIVVSSISSVCENKSKRYTSSTRGLIQGSQVQQE